MNPQSTQMIFDDIPVLVQRKKNIKRLSIKIDPYKGVILNAPVYLHENMIFPFLESAKSWINKHYQGILSYDYTHGEKHFFLGKSYSLNLIDFQGSAHLVLNHQQFDIYGDRLNGCQIQELLKDFYRTQAYRLLPERLNNGMMLTPWVKKIPKLKLRFMRSRYGSCSSLGDITLNIHLIKARIELIDYVILHELCHVKAHHHGPEFYDLMSKVQPNWQELKAELKQFKCLL